MTVADIETDDVVIGPLAAAADRLRDLAHGRRLPVVTDARVLQLYGDQLAKILDIAPCVIPEGEQAKGWATLQSLIESFAALNISRTTPVIGFGGGSVGDVAGLAAALFKRGCPIIHIPTTLLAQVDSAIGGKTAIDAAGQKNLVGAFHPPALVVCDPAFLRSLDPRQLRAGYAEVVKYGLIDDPAFFAWCEQNGAALVSGGGALQGHAVAHCVKAKGRLVADDLRDLKGKRALLNLGHSFGHAVEALTAGVLHGEAVAVGMTMAFGLSGELGHCPPGDADRVRSHLRSSGLPTSLGEVGLGGRGADLLPLMRADKKNLNEGLTLVLVGGIGRAFLARQVEPAAVARFLDSA